MADFRSKFVRNVSDENLSKSDSESFVFAQNDPERSYRHERSLNLAKPLPDPNAPFTDHPPSSAEQHELSTFSNPFQDPRNPFDSSTITRETNGYRVYPELQPTGSEAALYPYEPVFAPEITYPHAGRLDLPPEPPYTDKPSLRQHERNRIKLEQRLPRYHVTKLPWFTMLATVIQVSVFIAELAKMGRLTGSPLQTKPYFNPMIGPSPYLLINMGARYVPCMHRITNITLDTTINFPCPNSTSLDSDVCNLSELCGLSGVREVDGEFIPDQWYRVVTPIFLHAGFLHIAFNMLLQLTMGAAVERQIGWLKFGVIYMASGIAGFLLGANFSPDGIASTGALGALFGIIATNMLLFIFSGRKNTNMYGTKRYGLFMAVMVFEVLVSFALGLLPGLDNFSHIGGFCMGLLLSVVLLQDPSHVYVDGVYTYEPDTRTWQLFLNNWNPMNKWHDKVAWKATVWMVLRVICLTLAILFFALLFRNLYSKGMRDEGNKCSWCKYINCIPVHDWCDQGQVTVTTEPATPTASLNPLPLSTLVIPLADSTLPASINNPNNKRNFDVFVEQPVQGAQQNCIGLVLGIAFFSVAVMFFMRRRWKSKN